MENVDVLKRIEKMDKLVNNIKTTYKKFLTLNLHDAFNNQHDTVTKINKLEDYLFNLKDVLENHIVKTND